MKCPNCGADIEQNSRFCSYCNSPITIEMQRTQEQLNKSGCPKCGSTNITFKRENQGEVRGKKGKQIVHKTVGFCKDCGYTWYPNTPVNQKKSDSKMWLWVLGWIFIFPVPLTILMLRNKNLKPVVKYGIIAAGWIVYLIIGLAGGSGDNNTNTTSNTTVTETNLAVDVADTPENELNDLAIGESVTIRGITVTVNSVTDSETSTGSPAYEVSVTYANHSGKHFSASPYDWTTVLHTGSDKAYVGGKGSFNTERISDGEEWTGVVTLWKDDNSEKIKFESSSLNLGEDKDLSATWLLPDIVSETTIESEEVTTEESTEKETTAEDDTKSADEYDFIITVGELGNYGFENTLNAGTEFEETQIVYHIPAGKYKVKYMGINQGQIGAMSDSTHKTEEGWEEPESTGDIVVLKPNDIADFEIEDGYYLEIHADGKLGFTKVEE